MPNSRTSVPDEIVNGARIHREARENKRVYCLGPGGSRINFLSQQIRALNVVWGLFETKEFVANDKVAVVGAGLAGVTAAIALRGFGASVHLYDKLDAPLSRQLGATHREVYPDINFWPEASPPNPSTGLPFLNWHMGRCDVIAQHLYDDWIRISKLHEHDLVFKKEEITDIDPIEFEDNQLQLTFAGGGTQSGYRLVIIACGYGEDVPHSEFPAHDYWIPDALEGLILKDPKISDIIVSGAGDGGQIDALRASSQFRLGRLAFELAKALQGTEAEDLFKWDAGRPNNNSYDEDVYSKVAQDIFNSEDDTFAAAREVAEKAFERARPKRVHLVQRNRTPYQTEAAIIHKLLVKMASGKGRLKVWANSQIKTNEDGSEIQIKRGSNGTVSEREASEKCHVIIRHGARDNFAQILQDNEVAEVRTNHNSLMFTDYKPKWVGTYPTPKGVTCPKDDLSQYIIEIHPRAQEALQAFGVGGASLLKAHDCFLIDNVSADQCWPKELYGIPVVLAGEDKDFNAID